MLISTCVLVGNYEFDCHRFFFLWCVCVMRIHAELYNDVTFQSFHECKNWGRARIEDNDTLIKSMRNSWKHWEFFSSCSVVVCLHAMSAHKFYVWLFLFIVTASHNLWNNDPKLYQHYSIVMGLLCDACAFWWLTFLCNVRVIDDILAWNVTYKLQI